jgi:hypothetical protein
LGIVTFSAPTAPTRTDSTPMPATTGRCACVAFTRDSDGTTDRATAGRTLAVLSLSILLLTAPGMSHGEKQPPSYAASSLGMGRVDVFAKGEGGYFCLRIPSLTAIGGGAVGGCHGVLLATAEARSGSSCSDYDQTALVFKRSLDGGATWGSLGVIYQEFNGTNNPVTIGNAAPVALGGGRVLMPFNRNNLDVLLTALMMQARPGPGRGKAWRENCQQTGSGSGLVRLDHWSFLPQGASSSQCIIPRLTTHQGHRSTRLQSTRTTVA